MSLEIEQLDSLKTHVENYPDIPIFYLQKTNDFTVLAGKISWKGSFIHEKGAKEFEDWLKTHNAIKVKKWKNLEESFA